MTLKGKKKFLRNIIVCLVAVVFVAGIAGVVYSTSNASVKIHYEQGSEMEIWDTDDELVFNKKWFISANENKVKFTVDLSDYKIESTSSEGDGGEDTTPPVEPENPGTEEPENPPMDGAEEGNETPDNVEVVSEGENTQPDENNETTGKGEVTYPDLKEVMDININSENKTIEFGNPEIDQYLEEGIFKGKYQVIIPLNNKADIDYNIDIELVVKENDFEIPVTNAENPAKSFTIVKDNTIPTISTNLTDNEIIKVDKKIEMYFSEEVDFSFWFYKCEDTEEKMIYEFKNRFGDKFIHEMDKSEFKDGDYKLKIDVSDKAGNSNSYEVLFTVNNSAPTVTIGGQEIKDFYNKNDDFELQLQASDNNGIDITKSEYKLVGPGGVVSGKFKETDNDSKTVVANLDFSNEGVYYLTVIAHDKKGEGGVIFENKKIVVDRTVPKIAINVNGKNLLDNNLDETVYINEKEVEFKVSDSYGFTGIKIDINGMLTISDQEINETKELKDGEYIITINATDKAGNETKVEGFKLVVDTEPVNVKFEGIENDEHSNTDKNLIVTIDDPNLQEGSYITIKKDTEDSEQTLYFENGQNTITEKFTADENHTVNYTVTVNATDKAGNGTIEENTIKFTIDKEKPVIEVKNYEELKDSFNNADKTLEITVNEKNLSKDSEIKLTYTIPAYEDEGGNTKVEVNLLKGVTPSGGVYQIEYPVGEDIDGKVIESIDYKVEFNVRDEAGNEAELNKTGNKPDTLSFTIDKKEPDISIGTVVQEEGKEDILTPFESGKFFKANENKKVKILITDNNLINNIEKNTITITRQEQIIGEVKEKVAYEPDLKFNVEKIDDNDKIVAMSLIHEFEKSGIYTLNITSKDAAENISEVLDFKFIVDNDAPLIEIIDGNSNIINNKRFFNTEENKKFIIKVTDENITKNTTIKVIKDEDSENPYLDIKELDFKDGVATYEHTFTEDGVYELTVISRDEAGNSSSSREENKKYEGYNFTVDNILPTIKTSSEAEQIGDNYYLGKKDENRFVTITFDDTNILNRYDSDSMNIEINVNGTDDMENWEEIPSNDRAIKIYKKEFKDNGEYLIEPSITDAAGNKNKANQGTINLIVDNDNPIININEPENNRHYSVESLPINITIDDVNHDENIVKIIGVFEGDTIEELTFNNKDNSDKFSKEGNIVTFTHNLTKEAQYTLTVTSTDLSKNSDEKTINFVIDRTNPIITIEDYKNLNNSYNKEGKDLRFNVYEENFNEYSIKVFYDKVTPEDNNDIENEELSFEQVNEERDKNTQFLSKKNNFDDPSDYTVRIEVTDAAGNTGVLKYGELDNEVSDNVQVAFTTDTVNPDIKIFFDETEMTNESLKDIHEYQSKYIKVTTYDVNQKDDGNTISIKKDDNAYDVDGFKLEGRNATFEHNFTQEGDYVVTVKSVDKSGRESERSFNFTIDTTRPVITVNDFDKLNNSFNNPEKSITINVLEHNFTNNKVIVELTKVTPDGIKTVEVLDYSNDGEATSHTYNKFTDDAEYTIAISSIDRAGNEAIEVHKLVKMTTDKTKPEVSITGVEEGEHYNTDKTVKILSHDVNHNINTVTVTKDGQTYSVGEFSVNGRDAVINHTFSQEGEYVITLYSKDKAGNDNTTSKKFTIDKTAPVITPVFKGENRVIKPGEYINKIFTPEFKLDEAEDKFDFITLNEGQNVTGAVPMSSTEMVYHYTGQASDKAGNTTPLDITFTVDVTNPEVKVTGIIDGYFNKDMKPEYEITDTNLDNENTIVTLNDKVFESGTKIKEQDYYNLKLLGADLASNTTARNIVFAIDKDKPVIKFLEEMSGKYFTEDFIPNFIIEDLTDYTIIAMTLDGVDYEIGDPITEEGKHVLYIEVKDKAENVESISVEFVLDKTPPKFIVNGIKNKAIYVEPVTAEITLENPLDKITGITVNGELAQGDVKEENGQQVIKLNFTDINDYEVVLKAVDEAGNETEEVINFKIAKKNIFTTIYANKAVFYPLMIALAIIAVIVVITVVRKNKKEETQEEGSEE